MTDPLLFIVEHAFQISGRGCVLVPGLSTDPGGPMVSVDSSIRLVTPAGQIIDTHIRGVEMLNFGSRRPEKITAPILVSAGITKEQVPAGTKVFLHIAAGAGSNGT